MSEPLPFRRAARAAHPGPALSRPLALGALTALALLPAAALAQAVPDPLRPPGILSPAAADDSPPPAVARQLQATRIGPDGRRALIDGQQVGVGDRIGDAEVLRIDAAEVLLRDDLNNERVLRFDAPGLIKRPVSPHGKQP